MREGRVLVLDEAVRLPAGRVRVTVQPIKRVRASHTLAEVCARFRARQRARGHVPPSKEEVDRRIADERASWDRAMRLYLDSAPIIYFVEGTPGFAEAVERRIGEDAVELVSCESAARR